MTETYKINPHGGVQRLSDGAFIPEDERNADWRAYQDWRAKGNEPFAADYELPAAVMDSDAKRLQRLELDVATMKSNLSGHETLCDGRWRVVWKLCGGISVLVATVVSLAFGLIRP